MSIEQLEFFFTWRHFLQIIFHHSSRDDWLAQEGQRWPLARSVKVRQRHAIECSKKLWISIHEVYMAKIPKAESQKNCHSIPVRFPILALKIPNKRWLKNISRILTFLSILVDQRKNVFRWIKPNAFKIKGII